MSSNAKQLFLHAEPGDTKLKVEKYYEFADSLEDARLHYWENKPKDCEKTMLFVYENAQLKEYNLFLLCQKHRVYFSEHMDKKLVYLKYMHDITKNLKQNVRMKTALI